MKNIIFLISVLITVNTTVLSKDKDREIVKNIKSNHKHGFDADLSIGSIKMQLRQIDYYANKKVNDKRKYMYWLEEVYVESASLNNALHQAEALANVQFINNAETFLGRKSKNINLNIVSIRIATIVKYKKNKVYAYCVYAYEFEHRN